jgi:hypothetical protein
MIVNLSCGKRRDRLPRQGYAPLGNIKKTLKAGGETRNFGKIPLDETGSAYIKTLNINSIFNTLSIPFYSTFIEQVLILDLLYIFLMTSFAIY